MRKSTRGVSRRKLQTIARSCCDDCTVDRLDRAGSRGAVTKAAVGRIAFGCSDASTTDALDALVN